MSKVYVGMSGGVDSSVCAALLKKAGHDITGVYMKNWSQDIGGYKCSWQEDFEDAKRVAVQLNIDFKMFDFQNEYRHQVVDYMVREYQAGRTPNPDIMCNQEVKFKLFLNTAISEGADFIATGHYARIKDAKLYSGIDESKDQSYFLYRLEKQALERSLMPIGELKKSKVRSLAKKLGLVTAEKKDSQGICFVGEVGIKDFLLSELGPQPEGPIIDTSGKIIGSHQGAIFYTIGQRHGLNVGGGLPYYVTHKDIKKNIVYVTTDLNDQQLWRKQIKFKDLHFIDEAPTPGKTYKLRLRHLGTLVNGIVKNEEITLEEEIRGVAAGQSVVIYDDTLVLGGGIIC